MIQLSFLVKAQAQQGQNIKIVGSLPELGLWNTQKALHLQLKKNTWEGAIFEAKVGVKFQFKIIRSKKNGEVEWQQLPNNSNRKFKPKCASQIHLQWSRAEGKVTPLTRGTFKVRGFPGVMINKAKNEVKNVKVQQEFDPYRDARDQQSQQSSEEQFFIVRRKMSDEIVINSGDLQQIYYSNSTLQVFSGLLKKIKIYVISKQFDLNKPLHALIQQQLNQLQQNSMCKWINTQSFLTKQSGMSTKLRRRGSLFDVASEEIHFQTLYSRTSYFILLDLDTAIALSSHLTKVPTCLFLPASEYKQVISSLGILANIQLICFDQPAANKQFYEYLKNQQSESAGQQSEGSSLLTVTTPSVEGIVKQLSRLRYRQPIMVNTIGNISQTEGLKVISQQNTICILDGAIVQNFPQFMEQLVSQIHHHSLVIVVCDESLSENILSLRNEKNIVIIYDNFQKVILEGEQYHPLRKFRQTLQTIRMKSKLYSQNYGGDIVDKENSIIYYLPQNREDWAIKIENECKNTVKKFKCFKITRKGTRVKVIWNLAKELRLIRTICEIKYTNFGPLGNINLVTENKNLKELKDDLKLIIEHKSQLFKEPNETKVNYYSFGSKHPSSFTILPDQ